MVGGRARGSGGRRTAARALGLAAGFACAAALGVPGGLVVAGDDEERPVVDTPAGRQAFEDAQTEYGRGGKQRARIAEAVARLGSKEAGDRAEAAEYLVALFRQTRADQDRGRTPRGPGYGIPGGPDDVGAALRWQAAAALFRATIFPGGTEALAPALWLWREEKGAPYQVAAMRVIAQVRTPDADTAIAEAVRAPHPTYDVLVRALGEVGSRALGGLDDALRGLGLHYREDVRGAAVGAATALGLPGIPPFEAAKAFPPSLDRRMRDLAALVHPPVSACAPWMRARRAHPEDERLFAPDEVAGWRLGDRDGKPALLDWFGAVRVVEEAGWELVEDTVPAAARRLLDWREAFDAAPAADHATRGRIEARLGIPRFVSSAGPWAGSLPDGLVAAWAYARGDRGTAAALLFPLLARMRSEGDLFESLRDEAARRLDRAMLDALVDVEPEKALDFACHLASPLFAGWREQGRARELSEEIPGRGDDFTTLALPTPAEWTEWAKDGERTCLVAYLAERLRLIRDRQGDIPGGISYAAPQYAPLLRGAGRGAPEGEPLRVVNPFVALLRLDPTASETAGLVPLLASRDHLLAYDLHRFLPNDPKTLHRVRGVVAVLLNEIADENLVDAEAIEGGDPERVRLEVEKARAWCAEEGDRRWSDRLALAAAPEREWGEAERAIRRLLFLDEGLAAKAAVRRAAADAEHRPDLVRLVANLDRPELVAEARAWAKDPDATVRFFAAWMRLRRGDRAAREGVDDVLARLRAADGWRLRDAVLDDLWASGDPAARAYVVAAGTASKPEGGRPSLFLLQRRVLAGDATALARVLDALAGRGLPLLRESPGDTARDRPDELGDADRVAVELLRWRPGAERWPTGKGDDADRARVRAGLVAWLRGQVELARAGKPTDARRMDPPRPLGDWGWISSGWVRRD